MKLCGFTTPEAWPKSFEIARHKVPICSLNYNACPDTGWGKDIALVTTLMFLDLKLKNGAVKESKEAGDSG